jgi:hypothetical protein
VIRYEGIRHALTVGFGEGLVPFGGDGLYLPPHYAFTVDDSECPYLIEIHVSVIDGQPRCADLRLRMRPGGSPVSSENLRKIPLARYVRESPRLFAVRADIDENGEVMFMASTGVEDFASLDRAAKERPRRAMTPELLRDVARVYLEAESKPTQAVMRRFTLSRPTAGRWVGLARKSGFIPPLPNEKEAEQ